MQETHSVRSRKALGFFALLSIFGCTLLAWKYSGAQQPMSSSTSLFGTPSMGLRAGTGSSAMIQNPRYMSALDVPGSGPWKNIAISAIDLNTRRNQMRDVSMQAKKFNDQAAKQAKQQKQLQEVQEARALAEEMYNSDPASQKEMTKLEAAVASKVQDMAGVTSPLGFFDPLGFSTDCPQGKLLFYREVELKHGRVAMLASLGILVGEQFHPFFGGNIDVPSYIAFQQTPLQTFWPVVVAAIAIPEVFSVFTFEDPSYYDKELFDRVWQIKSKTDKVGIPRIDQFRTVTDNRIPGDIGFDPLGLIPKDPKDLKIMQTKELNNGRLAMIAAAGMIAQELATGQKLF
jgi:hypothetical protein